MEWEYFVLFALVLAQMLRTNQMLATFHAQLDTLLDRQAILIMPLLNLVDLLHRAAQA